MSSPYTRLRTEEEELMYDAGLMDGRDKERERIIKLLETWFEEYRYDETLSGGFRLGMGHALDLIKGENKHNHELDVFGAPCLGGDFHKYCLKCGWVEPCEIDGENK